MPQFVFIKYPFLFKTHPFLSSSADHDNIRRGSSKITIAGKCTSVGTFSVCTAAATHPDTNIAGADLELFRGLVAIGEYLQKLALRT